MSTAETRAQASIWETIRAAAVAVLVCEGAGAAAGWATRTSVETWYPTLAKPWFTPPDWVFAPTWIVLYAVMGVAMALVWVRRDRDRRTVAQASVAFTVQLAVNVAWSFVFFGMQAPGAGLAVIAVLWLGIAATIERFARVHRVAAWMLVPYLLWVTYAAALNLAIVHMS